MGLEAGEPLTAEAFRPLARDHIEHPRNLGRFPESESGPVRIGEAGSAASGGYLRFYLVTRAGRIAAARYEVLGPPALIAAASCLSEWLVGLAAEPDAVPAGLSLAGRLGLPRPEHGSALLAEDAARRALGAREAGCYSSSRPAPGGDLHQR